MSDPQQLFSPDFIEKAVLIVITAVLTGGSTIVGVWTSSGLNRKNLLLQNKMNNDSTRMRIHDERLETLFTDFNRWKLSLVGTFLTYTKCMNGELDYNQALDLEISKMKESGIDYSQIVMIIKIHFPLLQTDLAEIHNVKSRIWDFINELKQNYLAQKSSKSLVSDFLDLQRQFENRCDEFLEKLATMKA